MHTFRQINKYIQAYTVSIPFFKVGKPWILHVPSWLCSAYATVREPTWCSQESRWHMAAFFPPLSNMLGSQFKKFYYGCNIMLFKEAAFSRMKAVIQHLDRVKSVNPAGPGNTTCWAAATSCWGHQAAPPQPPGCSVAWGQSSTKVLWWPVSTALCTVTTGLRVLNQSG